jgi:hypothetical protein
MSQINVDKIVDASGGVLAPISSVMRNRIQNGGMVIDQRNAGASITIPSSVATYTVDRWGAYAVAASKFSVQQSSVAPAGFKNSILITSLAATSVGATDFYQIGQGIEGFNIADLDWGTANAKTVTLSFWVRSSLTGTFGGNLITANGDQSYPFSYTISAANTFEQKTITVVGPTAGTYSSTNGTGVNISFSLGAGSSVSGTAGSWSGSVFRSSTGASQLVATSGATFYITGVQLEVGSQATSFEYRQYGTELQLCQRYYQKSYSESVAPASASTLGMKPICVYYSGVFTWNLGVTFPTEMRAAPTIAVYDSAGNANKVSYKNNSGAFTNNITDSGTTVTTIGTTGFTSACGLSTTGSYFIHYTASSEL